MAQIARAILLARAIATNMRGFFASIRASHEPSTIRLRAHPSDARHRTNDQQPADVGLPSLGNAAKTLLPAGRKLSWDKPKPCRKITAATEASHCRRKGFDGHCRHRTDARHGLKPPRDIRLLGHLSNFPCLVIDPGGLLCNLSQKITALFLDEPRQVIAYFIENGLDAIDMTDPQRNDMTVFVERGTQSIDQFGALVNDALACAE